MNPPTARRWFVLEFTTRVASFARVRFTISLTLPSASRTGGVGMRSNQLLIESVPTIVWVAEARRSLARRPFDDQHALIRRDHDGRMDRPARHGALRIAAQ